MNKDLRKLLASIVSPENEENWYKPNLFKKYTLSLLPEELEVLELPPEERKNYNCFSYVLGLQNDAVILRETEGFIYDSFIEKLLKENKLVKVDRPQIGGIILYRDRDGVIAHAGKVAGDDFIISKWSWGPILKHKVFDIPDFYGDDVSYYQRIEHGQASALYAQYKNFNKS